MSWLSWIDLVIHGCHFCVNKSPDKHIVYLESPRRVDSRGGGGFLSALLARCEFSKSLTFGTADYLVLFLQINDLLNWPNNILRKNRYRGQPQRPPAPTRPIPKEVRNNCLDTCHAHF